ncbi:PDC sensor domain-containing protein, partial [Staphylococcus aureus]|nr:PDC sensor domain-containing protein [Staphylococcus aureus]
RPALTGVIIDSPGIRAALKRRQPMISEPYIGASGYLLIFISQPVYTADGQYLGYVGGAIYLQEKNVLHSLLGENYYRDGSYLYVVD